MRHRPISFSALVLLLTATVVARADKTDDFIKAEMKRQNIPGLSLAVIKDGEIIKAEGYGLTNIKLQIPATPETVYKIASLRFAPGEKWEYGNIGYLPSTVICA